MIIPTSHRHLLCPLHPLLFQTQYQPPQFSCNPKTDTFVAATDLLDKLFIKIRLPKKKFSSVQKVDNVLQYGSCWEVFQIQRTKEYLKATQVCWWWRVGPIVSRQRKRQNCSHHRTEVSGQLFFPSHEFLFRISN